MTSISYLNDNRGDIERKMTSTVKKLTFPLLLIENSCILIRLFHFFSFTTDSLFGENEVKLMIYFSFSILSNSTLTSDKPRLSDNSWNALFFQVISTLNNCFAERDIKRLMLQNEQFYTDLLVLLYSVYFGPLFELSIKLIEKNSSLNPIQILLSTLNSLLNFRKILSNWQETAAFTFRTNCFILPARPSSTPN